MSDFSGARLKVERAKRHIRDLDMVKTSFMCTNPYTAGAEYHSEADRTVYFLDKVTPSPDEIALIAGDAVHNLRTALDFLAGALCTAQRFNGYFPICKSLEKYKANAPGKMKGIPDHYQKVIDSLQPYGGGTNLFWDLHSLDIADKHHLILTTVTTVQEIGLRLAGDGRYTVFPGPEKPLPLQKDDVICFLPGNHVANNDVNFTFEISFREPEVSKTKSVLATLVDLADLVERTIDEFG